MCVFKKETPKQWDSLALFHFFQGVELDMPIYTPIEGPALLPKLLAAGLYFV